MHGTLRTIAAAVAALLVTGCAGSRASARIVRRPVPVAAVPFAAARASATALPIALASAAAGSVVPRPRYERAEPGSYVWPARVRIGLAGPAERNVGEHLRAYLAGNGVTAGLRRARRAGRRHAAGRARLRRAARRRRLRAARPAGRHRAARQRAGRLVLRAADARTALGAVGQPARLARRVGRGLAGLPLARHPPRRRAPFLRAAGGRALRRRRGALQAQRVPLAPHRRPGVALAEPALPGARGGSRALLAGRRARGRRLRGPPLRHGGAGDRAARARRRRAARVPAARAAATGRSARAAPASPSRATC